MHAALLAALTVDRVRCLAGRQVGHHLALPRDDPEEHVGAHRRGQHCADDQERGAAREQLAGQPGGCHDVDEQQHADAQIAADRAVGLAAEDAADGVVDQPARHQEGECREARRHRRAPGVDVAVDQEAACVPQVQHREQREARHERPVTLPVEPVQVALGHRVRADEVLLRVVEAAAVHGPQLAVDALGLQGLVLGRHQAHVEHHEVERRADPGDGHDHVQPAQQQVGPIQQVRIHVEFFRANGSPRRAR